MYLPPNFQSPSESPQLKTFSMKWSEVKLLSCVRLFATPWTVAYQAPQSMAFSRQECWSGLPFPPPGNVPDRGIKPTSPALQADSSPLSHQGSPRVGIKYHNLLPLGWNNSELCFTLFPWVFLWNGAPVVTYCSIMHTDWLLSLLFFTPCACSTIGIPAPLK